MEFEFDPAMWQEIEDSPCFCSVKEKNLLYIEYELPKNVLV